MIECEEPVTKRSQGQLLLDYLTDSVVVHSPGLLGRPHVAPDSRTVVTLDRDRDGATLVVQEITGKQTRSKYWNRYSGKDVHHLIKFEAALGYAFYYDKTISP